MNLKGQLDLYQIGGIGDIKRKILCYITGTGRSIASLPQCQSVRNQRNSKDHYRRRQKAIDELLS